MQVLLDGWAAGVLDRNGVLCVGFDICHACQKRGFVQVLLDGWAAGVLDRNGVLCVGFDICHACQKRGFVQVLLDGWAAGALDRNGVRNLLLPPPAANRTSPSFVAAEGAVTLDVVVGAVGRSNQGFLFDTKGLTSPDVFLNGARAVPFSCCLNLACH